MADAQPKPVPTCTLANNMPGMQVFNLPHALVPERASMAVVGTRPHNPKTGQRQVRAHKRPISGSLTFLGKGKKGDTLEGLPRTVLRAPEVKAALAAGELLLVEAKAAPAASPAEAPKAEPKMKKDAPAKSADKKE